jgi:hypothetical protein
MPITKTQLKQIASQAWTESYNRMGWLKNYNVKISGNQKVIRSILNVLVDEMNERWDNCDYTCGYECDESLDDMYGFYVIENDRKDCSYAYNGEADDEIVADNAELVDESDEAPEPDPVWSKIRATLMKPHDGEFWVDDHLCLALNYGQCKNEGKHPKTSDEDWFLFERMSSSYSGYSQENCWILYSHLDEERLKIYWELEATSDNKENN